MASTATASIESATESADELMMSSGSTAPLPQTVAYVPLVKPAGAFTVLQGETASLDNPLAGGSANQVSTPQAAQAAASDAQARSAAAVAPLPAENPAKATPPLDNSATVTATDPATVAPPPAPPKKRTLFASLFGSTPAAAAVASQAAPAAVADAQVQNAGPATVAAVPVPADKPAKTSAPLDNAVYVTATDPATVAPRPAPPKKRSLFASLFGSTPASVTPLIAAEPQQPKPVIQLASAGPDSQPEIKTASLGGDDHADLNPLPGVRQTALFEIKRKSGLDDDSDVDLHEDEELSPIRLASAAGLARLAPNGLLTQTDRVDVACLKPSLVRALKTIERHYGRKIIVTSGYRSPSHNRRARGAKNSLHMYCAAADIQVPGIGKWELASYFRTMPGRGGVGTYCHTNSVHIDVGPERDWNWRCRRSRKS